MKFTSLTNEELFARLRTLAGVGRRVDGRVVAFLAEVERRGVHYDHAYSSLQDFCVRALGMSEGEAFRRMTAARLALRFPSIPGRIARGEIHLSALVLLRDYLTEENHDELLSAASGKTKDGVKAVIAERFPRPDVPSTITTIPEQATLAPSDLSIGGDSELGTPPSPSAERPPQSIEPLSTTRHRVEFTASSDLREKIERAVALMRHRNPSGDLAVVVERAVDVLLEKLEKEKFGKTTRPKKAKATQQAASPEAVERAKSQAPSRYVSNEVRREVHARDGEQCAFVDADGNRCPSRAFLERDHRRAYALGGTNDAPNIRMTCFAHNRRAAELTFGREHIQACIDMRQRKSAKATALADATQSTSQVRTLIDTTDRALQGMGFRAKETRPVLEVLRSRIGETDSATPPIAELLRNALTLLCDRRTA